MMLSTGTHSVESASLTNGAKTGSVLWTEAAVDSKTWFEIHRGAVLDGCKWDPQVGDIGTLSPFPLVLKASVWNWLARHGGDSWNFSDTGGDIGTDWTQPGYDDSGWNTGISRFGYGDLDIVTTNSYGLDPANKFVTTYFRRSFIVPRNMAVTNLNFRLAHADGAAVWLNGQELFRTNLPGGPIAYTNLALGMMTGFTSHIYYPTNIAIANSLIGTNQLAVELHLSSVTNTAAGFDMRERTFVPLRVTPSQNKSKL